MIELAEKKFKDIERLHSSYMKVLNYSRWVINNETEKDLKINSDLIQQLNKVYIGCVKKITKDLFDILDQFGSYTYKFIQSKECMFVDYDNPNAAYLCSRECKGLKIGRTPSYPTVIPDQYKNPDDSILYVSNVHQNVSEEILIDLFPDVEYVRMSYDGSFRHKGYCYIKFRNNKVVSNVLKLYSALILYGKRLFICPLVIKMDIPIFQTPKLPDEVYKIKMNIDKKIFKRGKILLLQNLLDVEEFDEDFKTEMRKELSKYGNIKEIQFTASRGVLVRCSYNSENECRQAYNQLNGRFFGGRRINAEIVDN